MNNDFPNKFSVDELLTGWSYLGTPWVHLVRKWTYPGAVHRVRNNSRPHTLGWCSSLDPLLQQWRKLEVLGSSQLELVKDYRSNVKPLAKYCLYNYKFPLKIHNFGKNLKMVYS